MRILFITPQAPYPPRQGAAIRNFNIARRLSDRHEVTVLAAIPPGHDVQGMGQIASYNIQIETIDIPFRPASKRIHGLLRTRLPDLALRLDPAVLAPRFESVLRRGGFDLVQVEGLELALAWMRVNKPATWASYSRPPVTFLDEHNAEYLLQKRAFLSDVADPSAWVRAAYSLVQWRRLRPFERDACRSVDRVVAVSPADRQALLQLDSGLKIGVVPNGVDGDYFSKDAVSMPEATPADGEFLDRSSVPTLCFTGTMDFRPNVDGVRWFCQHVFGKIRARYPTAQLFVVGQRPTEQILRLGRLPGVVVTGTVDDVRPYVLGSTVYVVPIRIGGGVRLKVMEAMAMGKPVVSTALGVEGIDVRDGSDVLVRDTPEAFADAVVRLIESRSLRRQIGESANALATARYDWRVLVPKLEELYQDAVERTGAAWRAS
jgi:polysaccharide biosynthesis protein PslH